MSLNPSNRWSPNRQHAERVNKYHLGISAGGNNKLRIMNQALANRLVADQEAFEMEKQSLMLPQETHLLY